MIDINDYSVVLLCAGIGSRLGKFTKGRPKQNLPRKQHENGRRT